MAQSTNVRGPEVVAAEPDLTPDEALARARALIPQVRDQQEEAERAAKAVETLFGAASSPAVRRGQRLQRYYRDVSMYHGHIAAQYLNTAGELARVHLDQPDGLL